MSTSKFQLPKGGNIEAFLVNQLWVYNYDNGLVEFIGDAANGESVRFVVTVDHAKRLIEVIDSVIERGAQSYAYTKPLDANPIDKS